MEDWHNFFTAAAKANYDNSMLIRNNKKITSSFCPGKHWVS